MEENKLIEFKIATEDWEYEQIHKLNYQTFVREIPQHEENITEKLVDKFHDYNTYVICLRRSKVVGMLAICDQRPFSLESKVQKLFEHLPQHQSACEIRLLSVHKEFRNSLVFSGLIKLSMQICLERDYDLSIISATTRQLRLYKHLGFIAFGKVVGKEGALYQPMYIDIYKARKLIERSMIFKDHKDLKNTSRSSIKNYMPGPVDVSDKVSFEYSKKPTSHRSQHFIQEVNSLKQLLCKKVKAQNVQLLSGSGTLANDVVATYIGAIGGRGLLLVNGEFSQRLALHASSMGLDFDILEEKDGCAPDLARLEKYLEVNPETKWLWSVACETSTGVISDLEMLSKISKYHGIRLCIDGISAIGSLPMDLSGVYMATAVSGKGIGSLPGIAMVFYQNDLLRPKDKIPRYFDLLLYENMQGVPFTISTNAVYALKESLTANKYEYKYAEYATWRSELVTELEGIGLKVIAQDNYANHVLTIQIPPQYNSEVIGNCLHEKGYALSYKSQYLIKQNRIQLCFMGECEKPDRRFIQVFRNILNDDSMRQISL